MCSRCVYVYAYHAWMDKWMHVYVFSTGLAISLHLYENESSSG